MFASKNCRTTNSGQEICAWLVLAFCLVTIYVLSHAAAVGHFMAGIFQSVISA
jgi:hypothetical protein